MILSFFEMVGVAAFAVIGANVAMQKRLDVFGIYILAIITAMGGGITRDTIMDRGIPIFFTSYRSFFIILAATTVAIFLRKKIMWNGVFLTFLDALGLAVFTIDTSMKMIAHYNLLSFCFMSVITGVGGGVIRDILCRRIPVIFTREVYATASLAGALLFWFLHPRLGSHISAGIAIVLIIALRMATYRFKINLPRLLDDPPSK